jgi:hypothetical protein
MDNSTVSLLIHRICAGKFFFSHEDVRFVYIQPVSEIKYEAELLYSLFIDENKYDYNWSKDNILKLLTYLKLWDENDENQIKDSEKKLEHLKLNLYENRLNKEKISFIRKEIVTEKNILNKLFSRKHALDYLTIEEAGNALKNEFILTESIRYVKDNKKVFGSATEESYIYFSTISSYVADSFISIETYKKIARSDNWKNIWNSNKNNLFGLSAYELSDEQKTLISISNMYDKIYEHPESPEDEVIQDDDMLDGWMLYQKNKTNQIKKQGTAQTLIDKHKKAQEIFVVGKPEDIDSINALNVLQSKKIKEQRAKFIREKESTDDVFLPDVQMNLAQQLNRKT